MIDNILNVKIKQVEDKIIHKNFSAPTIDIYDEELNKKIADKFIKLTPKDKEEN